MPLLMAKWINSALLWSLSESIRTPMACRSMISIPTILVGPVRFSRTTVNELWAEGLADVRRPVADVEWMESRELGHGIRVYHLTR